MVARIAVDRFSVIPRIVSLAPTTHVYIYVSFNKYELNLCASFDTDIGRNDNVFVELLGILLYML